MYTAAPRTAFPGTASAGGSRLPLQQLSEGQFTPTVYGMIREKKFDDAIRVLADQLHAFPRSRAALSLLGYCYYHKEDYPSSVSMYEQLARLYPSSQDYKLYLAQSLYKCGLYPEATKVALAVDSPQLHQRVQKLLTAIKYEQDDILGARSHNEEGIVDDPDTIINAGCLLYKESKFEDARKRFQDALNIMGYQPFLAYNIAVCHYKMKQYAAALKYISEIIERGINEHPELSVGANSEGIEVRSVGNSAVLQETALVEAFNLKAAIEYMLKNYSSAAEALNDMPPRLESELDPVTLCNHALMNMEKDPSAGFAKLNFLLQRPPFPSETFPNLLLLYIRYGYADRAADVLAENAHLTYKYLSQDLYDFLEATITSQTSPEEAYRKFDDLATKHVDVLRRLTKQIQDSRVKRDSEGIKVALKDYDEQLERYIPVLMAMAKIYWDADNFETVERIFRQSAEFCSEHDTWKLNLAHTFFMQESKYKDAIRYYEPFVKKHQSDLLSVPAMVLANLCVSFIMTSQNEDAEEIMRQIEREEERVSFGAGGAGQDGSPAGSPAQAANGAAAAGKKVFHLCIVNLVIGTLYCAKGNFEFGISRIIKSLEPFSRKINVDTWFYAKRCCLALAENLAKHMIVLKDSSFQEIVSFLDAVEVHGKGVHTRVDPLADSSDPSWERRTVAQESRLLKKLFMQLREVH